MKFPDKIGIVAASLILAMALAAPAFAGHGIAVQRVVVQRQRVFVPRQSVGCSSSLFRTFSSSLLRKRSTLRSSSLLLSNSTAAVITAGCNSTLVANPFTANAFRSSEASPLPWDTPAWQINACPLAFDTCRP